MKVYITSSIKKYFNTHIEFIDHYWINFFKKYKIDYEVLPCDKLNSLKKFKFKKNIKSILILTGGSDVIGSKYGTKIRNLTESILIKKSLKNRIPILGICRGAQLFCKLKGFKIFKCKNNMRTKHKVFFKRKFLKYKEVEIVNSYHNYCIKVMNKKNFEYLALDKKKMAEFFIFNKMNYFIMWHPERNKDYNELRMLINSLSKKI